MASPMSLREAVEIVRDGEPIYGRFAGTGTEFDNAIARCARACAIVDAAIEAHEKLEALNEMQWPTWAAKQRASIEWFEAYERLRALERGEEVK